MLDVEVKTGRLPILQYCGVYCVQLVGRRCGRRNTFLLCKVDSHPLRTTHRSLSPERLPCNGCRCRSRSLASTAGVSAAIRVQLCSVCELMYYWLDDAVRVNQWDPSTLTLSGQRLLTSVHLLEQSRRLIPEQAQYREDGELAGSDDGDVSLLTALALPNTVPLCVAAAFLGSARCRTESQRVELVSRRRAT